MGVPVVGEETAGAALQAERVSMSMLRGDALNRDLCAFSSIARRVDGHRGGDSAGGHLLPAVAAGQDADVVIDQRRQVAIALVQGGLQDAVV